jgi:hypothetical protein
MEGSLVAYKVFTNGSVLQASEINDNLMRQSVMVFSNAAARSAAITVPLEGMLTWLEDTNQYENYNGSAWVQTIVPAGYSLIKSVAIGTSVTSVEVTEAFSATYDVYQIIVTGGVASGATGMKLQFGSTVTNYRWGLIYQTLGTNAVNGVSAAGSSIEFAGSTNTNYLGALINVHNPFLTRNTHTSNSYNTTVANDAGWVTGMLLDNNSYTSFKLSTIGAGSWTGGTIYVYGYGKS